jgi:hypothetical protein
VIEILDKKFELYLNREEIHAKISDLALLSQNLLTGSDLTAFIKRTVSGF